MRSVIFYPVCRCGQLIFLVLLSGCMQPLDRQVQGQTMGTYYSVRTAADAACDVPQARIEAELTAVNGAMSTYLSDSELSRFNQAAAGTWHTMSPELAEVMQAARTLWRQSGGAFDVTVGPLVNLWGFGPAGDDGGNHRPSAQAQAAARQQVGMQLLDWQGDALSKRRDAVYVDLSALAKGYAVDRVAALYGDNGCADFMVDIGGEIRVAGASPRGGPWRIGIEVPDPQAIGVAQAVMSVSDMSIATSGDYRNFRLLDGIRVDHVIDPRSGAPADNRVVSATVLHPSAMWADAYATTLMVMDAAEGMDFAERENIAVYLLIRSAGESDGGEAQLRLESRYNAAMANYLK